MILILTLLSPNTINNIISQYKIDQKYIPINNNK
eukprot:UN12828